MGMAATHAHSVHTPMSSDESDLRISASKKRIVAQKRRCVAVKRQRRRSAPCKITTAKKLPELSDVTICNHVSKSKSARQRPFLSPPTTIRADALGQLSCADDASVLRRRSAPCKITTAKIADGPRGQRGGQRGSTPLVDPSWGSPQASWAVGGSDASSACEGLWQPHSHKRSVVCVCVWRCAAGHSRPLIYIQDDFH